MIITANHYFSHTPDLHVRTWEDWVLRVVAPAMVRRGAALPSGVADGPPLVAEVRQGAWMVLCPGQGCKGAELAWEEGLFMCMSCFNNDVRQRYRATEFPAERGAIEDTLEPRPLLNRNWLACETVQDLRRENLEHSLPIAAEVR